jgi:hypothetical protein
MEGRHWYPWGFRSFCYIYLQNLIVISGIIPAITIVVATGWLSPFKGGFPMNFRNKSISQSEDWGILTLDELPTTKKSPANVTGLLFEE